MTAFLTVEASLQLAAGKLQMLTYWRVCCAFESACALPSGVIRGCEATSIEFSSEASEEIVKED
jgi:hypothetical protein